MADSPRHPGEEFAPRPPSGEFHIRKIYVKDVSFETPNTPAIFTGEWHPDADVNLRTSASLLEPGIAYDNLIQVMDTVRSVKTEDGGLTKRAALFTAISIGDAP